MQPREPKQLTRGKAFHKKIQADWEKTAAGLVSSEYGIQKRNGRRGRIDVFVDDDNAGGNVVIVEIKASDWDKMTDKAVTRNVKRQIRQIYGYLESQIIDGVYTETGFQKDVCMGIIFPKRPKDKERMQYIENVFIEHGIPVVWDDETVDECAKRNIP